MLRSVNWRQKNYSPNDIRISEHKIKKRLQIPVWWLDPTGPGRICTCRPPELAPRNENNRWWNGVEITHTLRENVRWFLAGWLPHSPEEGRGRNPGIWSSGARSSSRRPGWCGPGAVQRSHTCSYMESYHVHITFGSSERLEDPNQSKSCGLIWQNIFSVPISVADPDPYVFGHPGSGSVSQRVRIRGFGSRSVPKCLVSATLVPIQVPNIQTRYTVQGI